MSAENSGQDLSIEEILASIRQIISDDEDDVTTDSDSQDSDEVLELTERVDEEEDAPEPVFEAESELEDEQTEDDSAAGLVTQPEPEPVPEVALEPKEEEIAEIDMKDQPYIPVDSDEAEDDDANIEESILTNTAASAALEGFAALASRAALDRKGTGATTVEDIVRELMRPMLREWLDVHLPPLIEKVVQEELQRVARKASDRD